MGEPDPMDLVLFIEEAGEVVQAASKALRFGWTHSHPDYADGSPNFVALAEEFGQLIACAERLGLTPANPVVRESIAAKHRKLEKFGPDVFGRGMMGERP